MSDTGEVEVESPVGYSNVIPKDVQTDSIKLFGKWSYVSFLAQHWPLPAGMAGAEGKTC